jgi:hypothetical protein
LANFDSTLKNAARTMTTMTIIAMMVRERTRLKPRRDEGWGNLLIGLGWDLFRWSPFLNPIPRFLRWILLGLAVNNSS